MRVVRPRDVPVFPPSLPLQVLPRQLDDRPVVGRGPYRHVGIAGRVPQFPQASTGVSDAEGGAESVR